MKAAAVIAEIDALNRIMKVPPNRSFRRRTNSKLYGSWPFQYFPNIAAGQPK
jgi:hypothetical protein